jgi:hypothetical protein
MYYPAKKTSTSYTIPNSVTTIGENAFYGCTDLTSVSIPNSVTSIGGYAFNGCRSLTSVTIPNSVTTIESGTFSGCTGLTSVSIPSSVTAIGGYAFKGCSSLTSVSVSWPNPSSVEYHGGIFDYYSTLYVPKGTEALYQAIETWRRFKIVESATAN